VQSGSARINDTPAEAVTLLALDRAGTQVRVQTEAAARLLILTGQPLNEPVAGRGPFVMNTAEQIQQALADYQHGRMGQLT